MTLETRTVELELTPTVAAVSHFLYELRKLDTFSHRLNEFAAIDGVKTLFCGAIFDF